jgi:hypothetical protein
VALGNVWFVGAEAVAAISKVMKPLVLILNWL